MTFGTPAVRQSELIKATDEGLALEPSAFESLQISLRWPNYLTNSVHDKTRQSLLLSITLPTKWEGRGGELVLCENYQVENLQQNQRIIRQSKKNTSLKKRKVLSSLIIYIAVKNNV